MKTPTKEESSAIATLISLFIIGPLLGAWLWPYTINHWLAVAHKPAMFHWYYGALISLLPYVRRTTIVAAIVTWIALMFI